MRYLALKDRQQRGCISDLQCQPRFTVKDPSETEKLCVYVGDFKYQRLIDGVWVVEDVKGNTNSADPAVRLYKLKRTLVRVFKGIHVYEVKVKSRRGGVYTWTVDGEEEQA